MYDISICHSERSEESILLYRTSMLIYKPYIIYIV